MIWTALWSDKAKKQLVKLPKDDQIRILDKTNYVEEDPFRYIEKLSGGPFFRYRVGKYRIILNVINNNLLLHILKVKKRSRVYGSV